MKRLLLLLILSTQAMAAAVSRPVHQDLTIENEEIAAQEFACGNSILCYFPENTARQALGSYLDQDGIEGLFQIRNYRQGSLAWRTLVSTMGQFAKGCLPREIRMDRTGTIFITGLICDGKTLRAGQSKRFYQFIKDVTPYFRHVDPRLGGVFLSMNVKYKR